jgi:hypothetical protein
MASGMPTKYTDEIQAQADAYVNGGFLECGDVVPSRAGLALELKLSRETLTNWERAHPEFLGTLQSLSFLQERISLNGGLKGELNSTIVKLLLANHGYSDKQETVLSNPDGSLNPANAASAVLSALESKYKG